ncbi:hypothetical protein ABID22_001804 [Pontibacter aydingkolensis]|uniref:DUF4843 domain-containing protein n=1 Tax=Pontibacter aydingkolensis TaxID=1911536 RepID=A0ABS7CPS8_9BACT|nr:hypothetical protein [Pontibacter aydingkolensis]MBW7465808.1 hypothetical protein [Pontibacter aydingkolensis]
MKKILFIFIALIAFSATSCIENEDIVFKGELVELDAATWNANTAGKDYPALTRVPGENRVIVTSTDPLISRTSGKIKLRVNLVGAQVDTDQEIRYEIVPNETWVSGTNNAQPAIEGTHFKTGRTMVIPANSSFGYIEVEILNPGTALDTQKLILIELQGNDRIKPSKNEKRVGLVIAKS